MSCKLEEAINDIELLASKPGVKSIAKELIQIAADARNKLNSIKKSSKELNVYYSSNENASLSNLATRPFDYDGMHFESVEHAYQTLKSGSIDEDVYIKDWSRGGLVSRGRKKANTEGNWNIDLMHDLVAESFKQNPEALKKLLDTGDSTITHKQDRGIWKTAFPDILMKVREALGNKGNNLMYKQNGVKDTFSKELDKKLRKVLRKLYPEIKLDYTEQEILHGEGVMNQEVVNDTIKLSLKVVEALTDWATAKPSKYGGESQPVLSTIRLQQEAGIRKKLAGKGVPKEQIDFVFKYMEQNDIVEISTSALAERVLMGLAAAVEVKTTTYTMSRSEYDNYTMGLEAIRDNMSTEEYNSYVQEGKAKRTAKIPTHFYEDLSVPGGTNYQEKEIATPSIVAPKKGHARFATDNGIGWYRVDDSTGQDGTLRVLEMQSDIFQKMKDQKLDAAPALDDFKQHLTNAAPTLDDIEARLTYIGSTEALADLEYIKKLDTRIQEQEALHDYEQFENLDVLYAEYDHLIEKWIIKGKPIPLEEELNKSFLQLLNTDNKWVKFFIQSIVQDSQKKGYEKIRFPAGSTAAKVEGHYTVQQQLNDVKASINTTKHNIKAIENAHKAYSLADYIVYKIRYTKHKQMNIGNQYGRDSQEYREQSKLLDDLKKPEHEVEILFKDDIELYKRENTLSYDKELAREKRLLGKAMDKKERLMSQGLEKLAPIEGFYQVRVKNTLVKTYGKDNVKTVTDEHGNQWFELKLNSKRDSNVIMLQKQEGQIKGQANIEAKTVLINSLLQSQDTLPHEYAHHYIAWFREAPIVQEAIKKWGSEEALVQAIGEQAVKQKGEAWDWWKKFSSWLKEVFSSLDNATKEQLAEVLTDAFLTRKDLNKLNVVESRSEPKAKTNTLADKIKAKENLEKGRLVRATKNSKLAGIKLTATSKFTGKDQLKANKATKFIGIGAKGSSTDQYRKDFRDLANTGEYSDTDTVFISVNGNRPGRVKPDFNEVKKALDANAVIVTDSKYDRNRSFNIGEREVAKFLEDNGYIEQGDSGVWSNLWVERLNNCAKG